MLTSLLFLIVTLDEQPVKIEKTITVSAPSRRPERIVDAPASVTALTPEEIEPVAKNQQLTRALESIVHRHARSSP